MVTFYNYVTFLLHKYHQSVQPNNLIFNDIEKHTKQVLITKKSQHCKKLTGV